MNRLLGRIQHYDWGGKTFLPSILQIENPHDTPYAEYWLGVHAGGPSTIQLSDNATTKLSSLIQSDRRRYLGDRVSSENDTLPYLLKILDVKQMLSIQVHPTREAARAGFQRENEMGIALDSPLRNYKDENHKPEIMVALSDFWLLHGFAPDIAKRVDQFSILSPFKADFELKGIKGLYEKIMELPQAEIDDILRKHSNEIIPAFEHNQLQKDNPDYWAAKAYKTVGVDLGYFDRGIFSIYLFNLLNLRPGQGIFQGAGMPHAYLEGQNIELMSNSDNVLRAGLTKKHIDIPELLSNIEFVATEPQILNGNLENGHNHYESKVPDFDLHSFSVKAGSEMQVEFNGPSILLLLEGKAEFLGYGTYESEGFNAFFIQPQEKVNVRSFKDMLFFVATIPG